MEIYNVYQSGKRLYIDEKEIPDNKIVVNKYENEVTTLRLVSDGTLPPRLYWALRNPKLSNKYFILKLVNNQDLIVGTDISAYPGLWDMLLIGTDEDYIIEGTDIDQSRLTYVSDHFGRLFVRDNFLEELDFEEQCSPTFKVFYDEIMFQLHNKVDKKDISAGGNIEVDDVLDKTSTNPVQNKVITKEVNSLKQKDESLDKEVIALRERNAELEETIEKLQIKTTTSPSPCHHITDSANMKVLDFGMEGITEQNTVPGNQLFDLANSKGFVSLYSGLSTEIDVENNTLTTTNTHTGNRTGYLDFGILEAGTYCLSYENVENVETMAIAQGELVAENMPKTIKTISPTDGLLVIGETYHVWGLHGIPSNGALKLKNIMLNPGNTALPIEKYVGGMPSPNPEHEEEITLAGVLNEETGRYEHKCLVVNENHADISSLINGIYVSLATGQEISEKNQTSSDFVLLQTNDIYICFSGDVTYKKICFYDSDKNFISGDGVGSGRLKLTIPSGTRFIRYSFTTVSDINGANICIETTNNTQYKGAYTPHASQPFTLTSDRPLTMWDKLVKRDGVWGWSIWSGILNVTDSTGFYIRDCGGLMAFQNVKAPNIAVRNECFCEMFRGVANPQNLIPQAEAIDWLGTIIQFYMNKERNILDLASFGSYLSENPITVIYHADEEQAFIPLPDEEQTLLNNLETYYGVTNVYNEQGCPMWLTYIVDNQLYFDNKIEEINNALLSLGANI